MAESKKKKEKVEKVEVVENKKTNNKDTKLREIPFKNYIILMLVCFLTIGLVVFVSIMYRRNEKKNMETPVISGVIPEIKRDDVGSYVIENDSFFLYIGSASDYNSREVEKDLIKYFDRRNIKDDTIFLNVTGENELNSFYKFFNEKFVVNEYSKLNNYPAFIIFKDGKVLDLVQKGENQKLNIGDIDRVLDEYGY
jgi:hypothetical protein